MEKRRAGPRALLASLVLSLLCSAPPALAQDAKQWARAKQLFDTALELMDRGQHATACPMLAESLSLDPGMGTRYHLARCYERVGRLASAHQLLLVVATEARRTAGAARALHAEKQAHALRERLPMLAVVLPPGLRDDLQIVVVRDRAEIPRGQYNRWVPVDLGEHEVLVRRRSATVGWRKKVFFTQESQKLEVRVPALDALLPSAERGPAGQSGAPLAGDAAGAAGQDDRVDGMLWGGVASAVGAVAAAGVAIWAALEVGAIIRDEAFERYQDGFSTAEDVCDQARAGVESSAIGAPPPSEVAGACDRAGDMEIVQAVMIPSALALAGLGLGLILASDTVSGDDEPSVVDVSAAVTDRGAAVGLRVRF